MTLATSRPRGAARIAAFVGAGALAVVALTGCIKVDADLAINADATGSGTLGFELQKEAASFMGITDLDSFKSQVKEGDLADSGISAFGECSPSETDTGFLYSCSFSDQEFTDPTGIWTITKSGDSMVFHMVNAGQTGTEGSDASALLGDASLGSINVKVTFPGNITAVTGSGAEKTSDTTATISGTMTTPLDVTITSESSGGGPKIAALLVVLGLIAIVVLIIIVVLLVRRRKPAPEAPEAPTGLEPQAAPAEAAATTAAAVVLDDAGAPTQVLDTATEPIQAPATEPIQAPATESTEPTEAPATEAPAAGEADDPSI